MFYSFRVAAWPVSQRIPFLFDLSSLLQRGNYIFSIWRVSALFAFRVCVISFISSIYPPVVSVDYSFCSLNAHSVLSPCIFPSFLLSFHCWMFLFRWFTCRSFYAYLSAPPLCVFCLAVDYLNPFYTVVQGIFVSLSPSSFSTSLCASASSC